MSRRVVMLTTSYPRFPGDGVGTFVEPIANSVAVRGHEVHLVAPWHPLVERPSQEGDVHFHFFRYAPTRNLHVFGYASALKADVSLRGTAYLVAPLAVSAGAWALRRILRSTRSGLIHAHWAVPGGFIGAIGRFGTHVPLVVSLHGSDVYLAEVNQLARAAARYAFSRSAWLTACSDDLATRAVALGADPDRITVVPYGVDTERFSPDPGARTSLRQRHALAEDDSVLVAAGRLVRKKGFEYLIDALPSLTERFPRVVLVVAGGGDLEDELRRRAATCGVVDHVIFLGSVKQGEVARWLAAADVVVVPSVRDDSGNVDGLPNVLLEALSSGTPVVATAAGGMGTVAKDGVTARIVRQRDAAALAGAISDLLQHPSTAGSLGRSAREEMCRTHSWDRAAAQFDEVYARATRSASPASAPSPDR